MRRSTRVEQRKRAHSISSVHPEETPRISPKKKRVSNASRGRRSGSKENDFFMEEDRPISPAGLAHMLEVMREEIMNESNMPEAARIELGRFDVSAGSSDEFNRKREHIRGFLGNTTMYDTKTQLNYDEAAVAGAKLLVDHRIATRGICKQLKDCGIHEDEVLYKPLDLNKKDFISAKEQSENRQASVVESLMDFEKQLAWKTNLVDNVAKSTAHGVGRKYPKTEGRQPKTRAEKETEALQARKIQEEQNHRGRKKQNENFRTPRAKVHFNALDERKIIEKYALEVASEVREDSQKGRRQIAPVPFNINLLDDFVDEKE